MWVKCDQGARYIWNFKETMVIRLGQVHYWNAEKQTNKFVENYRKKAINNKTYDLLGDGLENRVWEWGDEMSWELRNGHYNKGKVQKFKKRESMVFDHTLQYGLWPYYDNTPPLSNLIQNIFLKVFLLYWVSYHSIWILIRKQTLENIF